MNRLHSHDVVSGNTYDGTWTISGFHQRYFDVIWQNFEVGDLPWVYDGADTIEGADSGGSFAIVLPASYEDDKTLVAADLQIELRAQLTASPACTVTYNPATDSFDIAALDATTTFLWSNAGSTASGVFNLDDDTTASATATWPAVYVDLRPPLIAMNIAEAKNRNGDTTGTEAPTLWLALDDMTPLDQRFELDPLVTPELNISLHRTNLMYAVLPTGLRWTVLFK